ncbi:MAG: hypothetical protein LBB14_02695 [Puniceicoccales bacterium]|jgi:hypothetical protein|nr:hypothetical protein [Puniceicoccales bacterium]
MCSVPSIDSSSPQRLPQIPPEPIRGEAGRPAGTIDAEGIKNIPPKNCGDLIKKRMLESFAIGIEACDNFKEGESLTLSDGKGGIRTLQPREISKRLKELFAKAENGKLSPDEQSELRKLGSDTAEIMFAICKADYAKGGGSEQDRKLAEKLPARLREGDSKANADELNCGALLLKKAYCDGDPEGTTDEAHNAFRRAFEYDFPQMKFEKLYSNNEALDEATQARTEVKPEPIYLRGQMDSETGKMTYQLVKLNEDGTAFEPYVPKESLEKVDRNLINDLPSPIKEKVEDILVGKKTDPSNIWLTPEIIQFQMKELQRSGHPIGALDSESGKAQRKHQPHYIPPDDDRRVPV